ncbi:MAG TPA: hypothetical protein DEB66_06340 [Micrococcaceae bacterium]|nr:hypothetical protein [Micrococcaceae bacterium]
MAQPAVNRTPSGSFLFFLLLSFGVYGPPSNPQATCCASGVLHSEILVTALLRRLFWSKIFVGFAPLAG